MSAGRREESKAGGTLSQGCLGTLMPGPDAPQLCGSVPQGKSCALTFFCTAREKMHAVPWRMLWPTDGVDNLQESQNGGQDAETVLPAYSFAWISVSRWRCTERASSHQFPTDHSLFGDAMSVVWRWLFIYKYTAHATLARIFAASLPWVGFSCALVYSSQDWFMNRKRVLAMNDWV